MIQTKPLTGQCPRCGAPAAQLAYHSRYTLRDGQPVQVFRCRWCRRTFCDRYGTAFYDLKTPEPQVERALRQSLEGLGAEAVARVEVVHPTTVQRSRRARLRPGPGCRPGAHHQCPDCQRRVG